MKLELSKHKENISEEIHMLQALNTKDKEKVPKYLKYQDKGFMYFPREEVMPFLQEVDTTVKTVYNEKGFHKYMEYPLYKKLSSLYTVELSSKKSSLLL